MKVRLADVGDPLGVDPFTIGRGDARSRSMRRAGTGGGGGTDDTGGGTDDADKDDDADDSKDDADDDSADDDKDDDADEKKSVPKTDLDKAIKRRDAALARARKAEAELAKTKEKEEKDDPVAKANTRIVRTATHGVLRGLGIEDKADRESVLEVLRLDDIEVDDNGADEDAIEERINDLRRILGAGNGKATKRVPKGVDTRDKGGKGDTKTDPDEARYKRILGRAR